VRAVTEGQGAMGETVVRLVNGGKLYGGRGISTDIVGASIAAYVSALNKIAYEEAQIE
jgi:2-isopropylmalate synthase